MDMKKILIIFLLIVIYSIVFWPTLNIYTHTTQNVLVKINRITGESYYCYLDEWRKFKPMTYSGGFKPIEEEPKTYSGGVKILGDEEKPNEFTSYEDSIKQQTEDKNP